MLRESKAGLIFSAQTFRLVETVVTNNIHDYSIGFFFYLSRHCAAVG